MSNFEAKINDLDPSLSKIVDFLMQIGFDVMRRDLPDDTFLPGIAVEGSVLLIDPEKLKYPSDLLHEAGHLAVLTPVQRQNSGGDFSDDAGNEMAAIAWSYAASVALGLPLLAWKGMTRADGDQAFPRMKNWLCTRNPQAV